MRMLSRSFERRNLRWPGKPGLRLCVTKGKKDPENVNIAFACYVTVQGEEIGGVVSMRSAKLGDFV